MGKPSSARLGSAHEGGDSNRRGFLEQHHAFGGADAAHASAPRAGRIHSSRVTRCERRSLSGGRYICLGRRIPESWFNLNVSRARQRLHFGLIWDQRSQHDAEKLITPPFTPSRWIGTALARVARLENRVLDEHGERLTKCEIWGGMVSPNG